MVQNRLKIDKKQAKMPFKQVKIPRNYCRIWIEYKNRWLINHHMNKQGINSENRLVICEKGSKRKRGQPMNFRK